MPDARARHPVGALLTRHARSLTLLAVIVGVLLRLAFSFGYWVGKPLTHDEHEYLILARNIAGGRGFTYGDAPAGGAVEERFSRPPLYPLFIAVVARGPLLAEDRDTAIRRVKIAQAVVGAIGIWLVARLALCGAGPAAVLAALLAAVYPPLVWMTGYVLSEALYSTLALASVLALGRAAPRAGTGDPPRARHLTLAGLLAGAATLTRSIGLLFIALAVIWLACRSPRRALAFAVGALLVLAPWGIRNSVEYRRPMLVAAEGGVNFWVGNHPLAGGEGDMAANPRIKQANVEFRQRHAGLSPEALEPLYYRDALGHIAERPLWWLGLLARKVFYTWVPVGPSYTLHSRRYYVASLVSYGLLAPFGIAGAVWLVRRRAVPVPLFLLAASTLVAELIFFPQERYRLPVLDPVLIVCAAAWVGFYLEPSGRGQCATPS